MAGGGFEASTGLFSAKLPEQPAIAIPNTVAAVATVTFALLNGVRINGCLTSIECSSHQGFQCNAGETPHRRQSLRRKRCITGI
jgi:hypothetical protein